MVAADQFLLDRDDDWTWEDVEYNSMHPVDYYQVYKGSPGGTFTCVHSTNDTAWPLGGDAALPADNELWAYVVTAVNPAGEESSGGEPPRTLTGPCGAPGP